MSHIGKLFSANKSSHTSASQILLMYDMTHSQRIACRCVTWSNTASKCQTWLMAWMTYDMSDSCHTLAGPPFLVCGQRDDSCVYRPCSLQRKQGFGMNDSHHTFFLSHIYIYKHMFFFVPADSCSHGPGGLFRRRESRVWAFSHWRSRVRSAQSPRSGGMSPGIRYIYQFMARIHVRLIGACDMSHSMLTACLWSLRTHSHYVLTVWHVWRVLIVWHVSLHAHSHSRVRSALRALSHSRTLRAHSHSSTCSFTTVAYVVPAPPPAVTACHRWYVTHINQ